MIIQHKIETQFAAESGHRSKGGGVMGIWERLTRAPMLVQEFEVNILSLLEVHRITPIVASMYSISELSISIT